MPGPNPDERGQQPMGCNVMKIDLSYTLLPKIIGKKDRFKIYFILFQFRFVLVYVIHTRKRINCTFVLMLQSCPKVDG